MNGLQGCYESPELVGEIPGLWIYGHFPTDPQTVHIKNKQKKRIRYIFQ